MMVTKIINTLNLNIPINNQDIGLSVCDSVGNSPYVSRSPSEEKNLFYYSSIYSLKTNYPQCDQDLHVVLEGRGEKYVPDCYGEVSISENSLLRLPVFMAIINTGNKDMIYEMTPWGWAAHHDGGAIIDEIPTQFKN